MKIKVVEVNKKLVIVLDVFRGGFFLVLFFMLFNGGEL